MRKREIWKDIPGYVGCYQVSNKGRVKSLSRLAYAGSTAGQRRITEKILKASVNNAGYRTVSLAKGGRETIRCFTVSSLVLKAWVKNPKGFRYSRHRDGNPLNDEVKNLKWSKSRR